MKRKFLFKILKKFNNNVLFPLMYSFLIYICVFQTINLTIIDLGLIFIIYLFVCILNYIEYTLTFLRYLYLKDKNQKSYNLMWLNNIWKEW